MRHGFSIPVLLLLLALPVAASAQLVNGDFEAAGTGWTPTQPPNWTVEFLAAGGNPNGFAHIQSPFGNSGGEGCVEQTFVCGADPAGHCQISVDYRHRGIDASPLTGRVRIWLDGVVVHTSAPSNDQGWTTVTFSPTCGTHVLRLCLQVDAGNNGWEAGFDNVTAFCDIPVGTDRASWGVLKRLYD